MSCPISTLVRKELWILAPWCLRSWWQSHFLFPPSPGHRPTISFETQECNDGDDKNRQHLLRTAYVSGTGPDLSECSLFILGIALWCTSWVWLSFYTWNNWVLDRLGYSTTPTTTKILKCSHGDLKSMVQVCVFSCFSRVRLFETLWTAVHQAPLSMGFPRQEYWTGLPCPPPGGLPNPGNPFCVSCIADGFFTHWATWEALSQWQNMFKKTDVEIPFLEGWIGYVWGGILASTFYRPHKMIWPQS